MARLTKNCHRRPQTLLSMMKRRKPRVSGNQSLPALIALLPMEGSRHVHIVAPWQGGQRKASCRRAGSVEPWGTVGGGARRSTGRHTRTHAKLCKPFNATPDFHHIFCLPKWVPPGGAPRIPSALACPKRAPNGECKRIVLGFVPQMAQAFLERVLGFPRRWLLTRWYLVSMTRSLDFIC